MLKRGVSSTALIVGLLVTAPGWCQLRDGQKRSLLPNFDIRDTEPRSEAAVSQQNQAKALVERRKATLEAFLASPDGAPSGVRITPNAYGLPKILLREGRTLSAASGLEPEEVAKGFLRSHATLFPLGPSEVDRLRLLVKDTGGGPTFLAFNQTLDGIDVYNGQIKFTLTTAGEVVQVAVADVIPQLRLGTVPTLDAQGAVKAALQAAGISPPTALSQVDEPNGKLAFRNPHGDLYSPITAELFIFPITASSARLAYRIYLEVNRESWYEILIDAEAGELLYRHDLYVSDGEATVWKTWPTATGTRESVALRTTLVNLNAAPPDSGPWLPASPNGADNSGWVTKGNNVDAFLDTNGDGLPNITSDPNMQNGRAYSSTAHFDFPFGDGLTGQNPRLFQPAEVTNMFYHANAAHDYYYSLGFTEGAGNFQTDNYGRGGSGNDAVLAGSECITDNSYFIPTADGTAPHLCLGIYTRNTSSTLTDDFDTAYNGQTVLHEYGHGVSNRLVGSRTSTSCLHNIQSGAMGEGWSDYFAISYFNNPVYGSYQTQNFTSGNRRYSYEGYPYVYEDIGNGSYGYEVHDDGEIWAGTLWELRKSVGQGIADQLVVDGLKSTPCSPSMTDARNAILSADQARYSGAHRAAIWQAFAKHGLGYSARGVDGTYKTGTVYDAAYDLPTDLQTLKNPAITSNPLAVSTGAGDSYAYTATAANPNNGALSFVLSSGPAGMAVNSASGVVGWTASFMGQRVKTAVTDGKGGKVVHGYLLPVNTHLRDGVPVVVSGPEDYSYPGGTAGYASFSVPANATALQVTLRGGAGDADLFVTSPVGSNFDSLRYSTNNETLTFPSPAAGTWQISVDGWLAYSGVSLTAALITPTPIGANASLPSLSGVTGGEALYRVTIPAGSTRFTVATSGGTGDVDLYLRKGAPATCQLSIDVNMTCNYDFYSAKTGNSESITVTNPATADWFIDASAYAAYSSVTLTTVTAASTPLAITTTSPLPSGYVGGAYSQTLNATGGASPYTWSVTSGALPGGLTLGSSSGAVSGTPAAAGAFNFTAQVRDSAAATASAAFALTVTVPCTYSIYPSGQAFAIAGGSGAVSVTTPTGCSWTASGLPSWVTITSGPSGTGNGTMTYQAAANTGGLRSGTFTIAGLAFIVEQASATSTGIVSAGSMAQIASAGGWDTSLTLVNLGTAQGEARLSFYANNGSAPLLPFTFPQQPALGAILGSTFDQNLNAGATLVLDTTGPASQPVTGWSQLLTSGNIGGFAIFDYTPTGQEAVVPAETRNAASYLLAFDDTGALATGLAIANLATSAASVGVVIRDDTGTKIGTGTVGLPAQGHNSFMLTDSTYGFPATAGKRGTVEFDTPQNGQISVLGLRANGAAITTLPVLANVGTTGGTMAHVASGGGWQTIFTLVNTGTTSANATLRFFADDGSPLSLPLSFPQTGTTLTETLVNQAIPAGATLVIVTQGQAASASVTGSAQLTTNGNVSGFAIFQNAGQEAVVPLEVGGANSYILPFDNTGKLATGIALANSSGQSAAVPATLRDGAGATVATTTIPLAANGHSSQMLTTWFPAAANIRGTLEFDTPSGGQIGALGIRATPAGAYTTIPVMAK